MARGGNLDVRTIEAAQPSDKVWRMSDGGGLLLLIKPTGAKVWIARVTVHGQRRDMGLGGYPTVSLKEAREKAAEARKLARDGTDPILHRARTMRALAAQAERDRAAEKMTFRVVARQLARAQAAGFKQTRTAKLWLASLEQHVFPVIGDLPVREVDRAAVMRAVTPLWAEKPATAKQLLRRIAATLRYAAAHDWRDHDGAADLKMLHHAGLPKAPAGSKRPALPWDRVPAFMRALCLQDGIPALALRLIILTALRSNEVRQARYSWLHLAGETPLLVIPGKMMKGKMTRPAEDHRVPLAPAALDVLAAAYSIVSGTPTTAEGLPRLVPLMGEALVFPSATMTTPVADAIVSGLIRDMNAARAEGALPPWRDQDGRPIVVHGFRRSFRRWTEDKRIEDDLAAEKALGHVLGNEVSRAYRGGDLLDQRIPLMRAWAEHCMSAVSAAPAKQQGGPKGAAGGAA